MAAATSNGLRKLGGDDTSAAAEFFGVLESPLDDGGPTLGERVEVRGWVLSDAAQLDVQAQLGSRPATPLATGIARPDVTAAFPDRKHVACGFSGWIELNESRAGGGDLAVAVRAGSHTLHTWRRPLLQADIDTQYRQWRDRVLHWCDSSLPTLRPPALATWIVVVEDAAQVPGAERTAHRLRAQGGGAWDAIVISSGLSAALLQVKTPYVGLLGPDDELAPQAAALLRWCVPDLPWPDLVYMDHDHIGRDGKRSDPVFKPGWSPLLGQHPDIAGHGCLVRRELFEADPQGRMLKPDQRLAAVTAGRARTGWRIALPLLSLRRPGICKPVPSTAPAQRLEATLTVIIASRLADRGLLRRCLDGVRDERCGRTAQVIVVLNNLDVTADEARAFLQPWAVDTVLLEGRFNWSRLNNLGAAQARGDLLLFLNDDVEPLRTGWLDALLARSGAEGTGAVGAVLRYPDGRIQHAGIYLHGGERPQCRHTFRHCSGAEPRVRRWLQHDRTQTAVTGACLLTPRRTFSELGGFDERLEVVFNDVDYCLRLKSRGLVSVVAAGAELRHHEGISRGGLAEEADHRRFAYKWAATLPACDPHSHPMLQAGRDDWMFDPARLPIEQVPVP